jgi:glycyl-tRNA synthetase beta chain
LCHHAAIVASHGISRPGAPRRRISSKNCDNPIMVILRVSRFSDTACYGAPEMDLLFEIGCEELPASFVAAALNALPGLVDKKLTELRLGHGEVRALGTPRRLAVIVARLDERQADLEEQVMGPPVSAAFKEGKATKAAEAFAQKVGTTVDALERVPTPKGEYLRGVRRDKGRATMELLPAALAELTRAIPFRKSMRWGAGSMAFGRPIRWLCALYGRAVVPVELEGIRSDAKTFGHRFLSPGEVKLAEPGEYVAALKKAHVLVDPEERRAVMRERLERVAAEIGGTLIEDEFLFGENASLVEDPEVVAGSFDAEFLALPEEVILEVARGHQRYFGVRGADGKLMPRYLAVVNTAQDRAIIVRGNDRVMRARLADARFFHAEDLKRDLASRRADLGGIVFQNKLGSVLAKSQRIEKLARLLGGILGMPDDVVEVAARGAALCKNDLVSLMVGEFPELQGEVGRSYALAQGVPSRIADVIRDHYKPKGASDDPPHTMPGALVALADRLDTLVGCFAIGLAPTGTADPYALRRACIAVLRTSLARGLNLSLGEAFAAARLGYADAGIPELAIEGIEDTANDATAEALLVFFRERLKGLLGESLPADAVEAALAVAAHKPVDARARAAAIAELDAETRAKVGEVFKRATNIAREAPAGAPDRGTEMVEHRLYDAFFEQKESIEKSGAVGDYGAAFKRVAGLAPLLAEYFEEILVMAEDQDVRANRLRLMRAISETCSGLAKLEVLAPAPAP